MKKEEKKVKEEAKDSGSKVTWKTILVFVGILFFILVFWGPGLYSTSSLNCTIDGKEHNVEIIKNTWIPGLLHLPTDNSGVECDTCEEDVVKGMEEQCYDKDNIEQTRECIKNNYCDNAN